MKLQIDGSETVETDGMTLLQLKELKRTVDDAVDHIQHQLDMAKAERIETGQFADPKWYARAMYALKRKRKIAQQLQELLGQRSRALKSSERSLAEYFMDVCRERFDTEAFRALCDEAHQRRAAAQHAEMTPHP